jgi:hypothetical protein
MDRRQFRRDANLEPPAGMAVAEFANGTLALDFIRMCLDKSYTVTAGINLPFAVRKRIPESAAATSHGPDADPTSVTPSRESGGFSLTALTPKGERLMPEIARMLGRLEMSDRVRRGRAHSASADRGSRQTVEAVGCGRGRTAQQISGEAERAGQ